MCRSATGDHFSFALFLTGSFDACDEVWGLGPQLVQVFLGRFDGAIGSMSRSPPGLPMSDGLLTHDEFPEVELLLDSPKSDHAIIAELIDRDVFATQGALQGPNTRVEEGSQRIEADHWAVTIFEVGDAHVVHAGQYSPCAKLYRITDRRRQFSPVSPEVRDCGTKSSIRPKPAQAEGHVLYELRREAPPGDGPASWRSR